VCRAGDPPRVLTLREQDRSGTIVATAPFVSEVDDIRHEVGRGPCVTAARAGRTVMSGLRRWRFGGGIARLGVHRWSCCRWSPPTVRSGR
jgi:hypothetical protein